MKNQNSTNKLFIDVAFLRTSFLLFFISIFIAMLTCTYLFADGIDIVSYYTRVGTRTSLMGIICMIIIFMLINYAINFVVIGLPAILIGNIPKNIILKKMILFTLLGQIADRIGAFLASVLVSGLISHITWFGHEGTWVMPLILFNFIFSGIAVGLLAYYYLRVQWQLLLKPSIVISIFAGIVTNPAWIYLIQAMGYWR